MKNIACSYMDNLHIVVYVVLFVAAWGKFIFPNPHILGMLIGLWGMFHFSTVIYLLITQKSNFWGMPRDE